MKSMTIFGSLFFAGMIFAILVVVVYAKIPSSPEEVVGELHAAIELAQEQGDYDCCIEPACTMCYLGHWKFAQGTCFCDKAISQGRDEDVCPECKKGLEAGLCSSETSGSV